MAADLFARAEFASATVNEIGNQFISATGFLVNNDFSPT